MLSAMTEPDVAVVMPQRTLKKIGSWRFWPTPERAETTGMP